METKKISIRELNPACYNPRASLEPGDPDYEKLKQSISRFGHVQPVVWNRRTGNVVGGHQSLKVLEDLGYAEADCVVVDLGEAEEKTLNHRRVHSPRLAACLLMPNGVRLGMIPRPRSGASHGLGDAGLPRGVSLNLKKVFWCRN